MHGPLHEMICMYLDGHKSAGGYVNICIPMYVYIPSNPRIQSIHAQEHISPSKDRFTRLCGLRCYSIGLDLGLAIQKRLELCLCFLK